MAKEHADDTANASPAAQEEPAAVVDSADVVYAELSDGPITGYLARPDGPQKGQPGIIVIHEWWGLNENIRTMTRLLAGQGYVALAVDLYGGSQAEKPADARTKSPPSIATSSPAAIRRSASAATRSLLAA